MGMFSWECKGCLHSILGPYVLTKKNAWMNIAVALSPEGSVLIGDYDGYGRIKGVDLMEFSDGEDPELWHHSCWCFKNRPKYSGPSTHARDQGHFIVAKNYRHEDPQKCGKLPPNDHQNQHSVIPDQKPKAESDLVLEVNPTHQDKTYVFGNGVGMLTPPIDKGYWLARVKVSKQQAVVCFGKFGTIGIGFQKETDWNTNLPYSCGTTEIYEQIAHNSAGAPKDKCIRAIEMLQKFAAEHLKKRKEKEPARVR